MPNRIQLRRHKHWRKPPNAIVVARPTKWGNPFHIGSNRPDLFIHDGMRVLWTTPRNDDALELAHGRAVTFYRSWLDTGSLQGLAQWEPRDELAAVRARILGDLRTLTGYDLCCWCPHDQPCHADVLLELANQEATL